MASWNERFLQQNELYLYSIYEDTLELSIENKESAVPKLKPKDLEVQEDDTNGSSSKTDLYPTYQDTQELSIENEESAVPELKSKDLEIQEDYTNGSPSKTDLYSIYQDTPELSIENEESAVPVFKPTDLEVQEAVTNASPSKTNLCSIYEDTPELSIKNEESAVPEFKPKDLEVQGADTNAPPSKRRRLCRNSSKTVRRPQRKESFKNALTKIRQHVAPKMQLAATTVCVFDNMMSHVIELFGKELKVMSRIKEAKTLTEKQLERVTKLCLPKMLQTRTNVYAIRAARNARKNTNK